MYVMLNEQTNIIEIIATDFITQSLTLRYDICTCDLCKDAMLQYLIPKILIHDLPEKKGSLSDLIEQIKLQQGEAISRLAITAIETVSKNPPHKLAEDKKVTFQLLLNKIFIDRGLDFSRYRREILKRRIALRIRANKLRSYSEYITFLNKTPEEYDKLFDILCINVSEFFRDPEVWVAIKYLLENLIRKKIQKNNTSIRIWSAGCANGEEAYSIAILLKDIVSALSIPFFVEVIGTDIDKGCLKAAALGEYGKGSLKNADEATLKKYFIALENGYRIKDEVKKLASFKYRDLISHGPIEQTDVILCRNVFIHFERSLQTQLLSKFHASLKEHGYLVMGKVETILEQSKSIFQKIDSNSIIYQKI
jgi:chemotaxis methyl-accepting protein methylase